MRSHILGIRSWEKTFSFTGKLSGIKRETVNYVGYYSAHEEKMKSVIVGESLAAEEKMRSVVSVAMVDCRRDHLWHKLLQGEESPAITHLEFLELISLVHHETMDKIDPRLSPLLLKPPRWYTGLSKCLANRYGPLCRVFSSPSGEMSHCVVVSPHTTHTIALASMDRKEGSLAIVQREQARDASSMALIESFVDTIMFYMWTQLL